MPNAKDRVIIDTNLWISFLLTKDFSKFDRILSEELLTLLFSEELLEEFLEVAKRPKFRKYFSIPDLHELLTQIKDRAEFIIVNSVTKICRDPKDNYLLSLAKNGKATHLITGDKDILDIKMFGKTKILTLTDYLADK